MAASCSSHPSCKYDVFINFRGKDTRRIFVCHLNKALREKDFRTFIDSDDLKKGNKLSELLKAIKDSRLSIIVFSETYASSRWCLEELVQILQCMDSTKKPIVVPIFYQVKPSHVRHLNGRFGEAFAEHQHDSNAQSWKSALSEAANLSGWESEEYKDDVELIEKIVEDISYKLTPVSTTKANGLVGMDYHINKMDLLLCPEADDDRIVGICGIPGIGKTTIARAVYDKLTCQFEHHHCFLEDVKEGFKNKSAVHMQEELLSRLSDKTGRKMTMEMLGQKKILLVLDDVENFGQVEALLGKQHSFASGSRIIITTRDRRSLRQVNATTYSPNVLRDDEALELFTQYAFGTSQPTGEYNRLSKLAVEYAHGLPLALKVLGAFLRDKSELEWQDELNKIEKIPHTEIQGVLKTSIDGLDYSQKNIFLDVACFFRGMDEGYVTKFLDSCGFFPVTGFRVLLDRALVTISSDNRLEMHDLLQEMGQEIVRQESIQEPGRRTRLCSYEDVNHVLTQNTATEAVEGIILDFSNSKDDLHINGDAFVRMTRLRLLEIVADNQSIEDCKQHLSGNLMLPSRQLRLLLWHGCPLKFLPSNFSGKNLIDLDMRYSHIEQLWKGIKPLEKLKSINLSHSQCLRTTPDFTEVPHLEKLILECCSSLSEVHPSVSGLENLVLLSLKGCINLTILPSSIHMKSLKTLDLSGCSNLEKFPEISEVMKELSELYLDGTAIKEMPSSIDRLLGLHLLSMRNCRRLVSLPDNICNLAYLQQLHLDGCSEFYKLPDNLGNLESLMDLGVQDSGIKQLPVSILCLSKLNSSLSCKGCKKMREPFSAWPPPTEGYGSYSSLVHLDLSDCNLLFLSDCIALLSSLKKLELCRNDLEHLPETMKRLRRLTHLELEACKSLKSIPELASSIVYIDAHDCTALETVSTPKSGYSTKLCFTFSNCDQLVQTNLFRDTVETHPHYQVNQLRLFFNMSLPGSKIPYWFRYRNSEIPNAVTAQLPLNWFDNKFLGFAICAVSNFKGPHKNASALFARCYCTFKGNHGEYKFNFPLLDWGFKTDRFLKSDHIFLGYVPWSDYRSVNECYYSEATLIEEENPVNKRYYTEATFNIQVRKIAEEHPCITSCGVHFYQGDFMEVQDQRTTESQSLHGSCGLFPATSSKRKRKKEEGTKKQRRGAQSCSLPTAESGTNDWP